MKVPCLAIVTSVILAAGCASASISSPLRDAYGEWHVARIYAGTQGHTPARDFVVRFSAHSADPNLVYVGISGINSHSSSMRVNGHSLTPEGIATQTLIGCMRRVDFETSDDTGTSRPKTVGPCRAAAADEDLIGHVLAHASSWREDGGTLLVRSNSEDAWIELRRGPSSR